MTMPLINVTPVPESFIDIANAVPFTPWTSWCYIDTMTKTSVVLNIEADPNVAKFSFSQGLGSMPRHGTLTYTPGIFSTGMYIEEWRADIHPITHHAISNMVLRSLYRPSCGAKGNINVGSVELPANGIYNYDRLYDRAIMSMNREYGDGHVRLGYTDRLGRKFPTVVRVKG